MSDEAKAVEQPVVSDNGMPSVEDVVALFKERGVETFGEPVGLGEPEPAIVARPVDGELPDEAPVTEAETEEEGAEEEAVEEVAAAPEPTPVPRPKSADYAELLERRKEYESRSNEFTTKEIAAQKRAEELALELEALKGRKPKNPMEALKASGFSYEELTSQVLGGYEEPTPDPIEEKLSPLKSELAEAKKLIDELNTRIRQKEQSELQKSAENAKNTVINSIKEVTDSAEEFEYIRSIGDEAYEAVNTFMLEYWNQYKTALDINEACAIIEKQYEKRLSRLWESERLRKKHGLGKETPKESASEKPAPKPRKTLTNSGTSSAPAKPALNGMTKSQQQEEIAKMLIFND